MPQYGMGMGWGYGAPQVAPPPAPRKTPVQTFLEKAGRDGAQMAGGIVGATPQGTPEVFGGKGFRGFSVSPGRMGALGGSLIGSAGGPLGAAVGAGLGGRYGGYTKGKAFGTGLGSLAGTLLAGPIGGMIGGYFGGQFGGAGDVSVGGQDYSRAELTAGAIQANRQRAFNLARARDFAASGGVTSGARAHGPVAGAPEHGWSGGGDSGPGGGASQGGGGSAGQYGGRR